MIDRIFTYKDIDYMLLVDRSNELLHRCRGINKVDNYYLKQYGPLPEVDRFIQCNKCRTPEVWHSTYSSKLDYRIIVSDEQSKNLFCVWCELSVPEELAFPYLLSLSQNIVTFCFTCDDKKNEKA